MNYLMLVNKNNKLEKNYVPKNLEVVKNRKQDKPDIILLLERKTHKCFKKMIKKAYKYGFDIICDSGYRSYSYQLELYKEQIKAGKNINYLALPGYSEHQTGLCVDVAAYQNGIYVDQKEKLEKEYEWLYNNSSKYGFILRYHEEKESITGYPYEPWHFRFVGKNVATKIMKEKITLEEYLEKCD